MDRSLTLVVAATRTNGIGISSRGLPWRLPKEMAYFVHATSEAPPGKMNAVMMGRKSWESIPTKFRPLKNRLNVVISSQKDYNLGPNVGPTILASSLPEALASLPAPSTSSISAQDVNESSHLPQIHRTFIIGGATIYEQALRTLPQLNRILLTRVLDPAFDECDVFLPEFRPTPNAPQLSANDDSPVIGDNNGAGQPDGPADEVSAEWQQGDHDALVQWVGFDVPVGVNEEKGVKYEYQMWVRNRHTEAVA